MDIVNTFIGVSRNEMRAGWVHTNEIRKKNMSNMPDNVEMFGPKTRYPGVRWPATRESPDLALQSGGER